MLRTSSIVAALLLALVADAQALLPSELAARRRDAAHRQRRIIFNNDGNDAVYECTEPTPENLLAQRTAPLAGTQVDAIFYCTWCAGFGLCTHRSDVAEQFTTTEGRYSCNITRALFDQDTDPLQIMVEFCRPRSIEIFWSMRMNDIHDGGMRGGELANPELFPQFKRDHPQWLLGAPGEELPGIPGREFWSAVDYSVPEVRERAFRLIEDVCRRYEIDGVELNFSRHFAYFASHAQTGGATDADREAMTALVARVRAMADEVGMARGRPLLIAVRVPDCPDYSREIGLDWERWLEDGLVDLLVVGGVFRLRPWEDVVAIGHGQGVPVYASLSPTYISREHRRARNRVNAYRGRAATAWEAGVDGIHMANFPHPESELWRQLGSAETLRLTDRDYWPSVLGPGMANQALRDGERFMRLPKLCPDRPEVLVPGQALQIPVRIAEVGAEAGPEVTLTLDFLDLVAASLLRVRLNETALEMASVTPDGLVTYTVPPGAVRAGWNTVTILSEPQYYAASVLRDLQVSVRYPAAPE